MKYLINDNMPLIVRNIIILLLGVVGVSVGVCFNYWVGFIFIIGACLFAWKKTDNIGPKDFSNPKWNSVNEDAISEAKNKYAEIKKIKKGKMPIALFVIIIMVLGFLLFIIDDENFIAMLLYIGSLLYAVFCTGGNNVFEPKKLIYSIKQQENINLQSPWTVERQMEIVDHTPIDMKTILKKDISGFMGVQVQTSVNNGPKGECPYTYCVLLAKKEFGLVEKIMAVSIKEKNVLVEDGSKDDDVSVVVIRKDGYETNLQEVDSIINYSLKLCNNL